MSEHRFHASPLHIVAAEDSGRMDCEDDDSRKVWVVTQWSDRRAVLTHAAPFMEAANVVDHHALVGKVFMARLDLDSPPPFEHEGGERLEWPDLVLAKPYREVYEALGIEVPQWVTEHAIGFDNEAASGYLRRWLDEFHSQITEDSAPVLVDTGDGLWFNVHGVRFVDGEVRLDLDLENPVERLDAVEEDMALDFGDALISARAGARVARKGWEGFWLRYEPADKALLWCTEEAETTWNPQHEHLVAEDWYELD